MDWNKSLLVVTSQAVTMAVISPVLNLFRLNRPASTDEASCFVVVWGNLVLFLGKPFPVASKWIAYSLLPVLCSLLTRRMVDMEISPVLGWGAFLVSSILEYWTTRRVEFSAFFVCVFLICDHLIQARTHSSKRATTAPSRLPSNWFSLLSTIFVLLFICIFVWNILRITLVVRSFALSILG